MKTTGRLLFVLILLNGLSFSSFSQNKKEEEGIESAIEHSNQRWFRLMQKPNVNYFKVKKSFEKYLKKNPLEGSAPREYGMSWLKTNLFYLDANGIVQNPPAVNYNAIKRITQMNASVNSDSLSGDWRMIGPVNTINGNGAGKGNNGGYAYFVRIDPTNTNKLFSGFVTGGLWMSDDNGANWHLTDANLPAAAYFDLDVCAADSNIAYAISGGAVIKSVDGGMSWLPTSLNSTNYTGSGYDLAVSPTNPNVVVAKWSNKIYRTDDGGISWTQIMTSLKTFSVWDSNLNSEVMDWDLNHSNIVYFTDRNDNQDYVDVYQSVDSGATFVLFQTLTLPGSATGTVTGWSKISTATNNPGSVYVFIGSGSNSYSHTAVQMFKLDVTTGAVLSQRINMIDGINTSYGSLTSLHHGDIAMDIHDDNKIVWGSYSQQNVQYSSDNGVTFSTSSSDVHSDLRSIYMIGGKVILGTDGAAYISNDGGDTLNVVTAEISNHELWGFGASFKSDILAAGCNHGPLEVRDSEAAGGWFTLLGADQGNSDMNPLDSVSVYSQGYDSYHVTLLGNQNWTNSSQQIDPGGIYSYFNSMEFHPNLYHTLITHHAGQYPGSVSQVTRDIWKNSLIRSDDNGLTVGVVYTFNDQLFREKICMTQPNTIYAVVGLSNNSLQKTNDGGVSWTDITPSVSVTGAGVRNISDIAVSDVNPNEIWVTYSGVQNTCKVLHSTDGGLNYTNLTDPVLTDYPITKIIFQRGTDGGVYVGNSTGIYYRNNTMTNWSLLGNGMPELDVRFMFINYFKGKLLIGTSRGAWDHDLYEHSMPQAQISASTDSASCQSPLVQFRDYSVVSNSGPGATYAWSFPGGNPATSNSETPLVSYEGSLTGNYDVTLTVTDQYGTNTQTLAGFIHYLDSACCESAPAIWTKTDIGSASVPSELCYTVADGNFKITSHAGGLMDPDDQIPFIYQTLVGDGFIQARVKDVTQIWDYSAGVMLRNSLSPNSSYVFVSSLDSRGVFNIFRLSDGGGTGYQAVTTFPMPMWLKLERIGNQVSTLYSGDGISWTSYSQFNLTLNDTVYVGLSATQDGCLANIDNASVVGNVVNTLNGVLSSSMILYPNPIKNSFTIEGMTGQNTIEIFSELGQLLNVVKSESSAKTINTENLTSGIYFVKVKGNEVEKVFRVNK